MVTNFASVILENEGEYGSKEEVLPHRVLMEYPIDKYVSSLRSQESLIPQIKHQIIQ